MKFTHLLLLADGDVYGTSDKGIVATASKDGETVVVDLHAGQSICAGDVINIEAAEPADWLPFEDEDEDEGNE